MRKKTKRKKMMTMKMMKKIAMIAMTKKKLNMKLVMMKTRSTSTSLKDQVSTKAMNTNSPQSLREKRDTGQIELNGLIRCLKHYNQKMKLKHGHLGSKLN